MSAQLALDLPAEFDCPTPPEPIPSGWYLRLSMALAASVDELNPPQYPADGHWLSRLERCWTAARVRAFRKADCPGALFVEGADARNHAAHLVRMARSVRMRTEAA